LGNHLNFRKFQNRRFSAVTKSQMIYRMIEEIETERIVNKVTLKV